MWQYFLSRYISLGASRINAFLQGEGSHPVGCLRSVPSPGTSPSLDYSTHNYIYAPYTHDSCKLTVSSSDSACSRNRYDTERRASSGHSWNQSMLVQLTMAGNFRDRTLRVDPTGEKQSTTWTSQYRVHHTTSHLHQYNMHSSFKSLQQHYPDFLAIISLRITYQPRPQATPSFIQY